MTTRVEIHLTDDDQIDHVVTVVDGTATTHRDVHEVHIDAEAGRRVVRLTRDPIILTDPEVSLHNVAHGHVRIFPGTST